MSFFLFFCLNCSLVYLHFCARQFSYFFITPRILSFDSHTCHVSYSSVLIDHSFNFISVQDSSLTFFITLRILSFDSYACHVSYSSVLIAHSFKFISVQDNSFIFLSLLDFFHLTPMHVMFLILLS